MTEEEHMKKFIQSLRPRRRRIKMDEISKYGKYGYIYNADNNKKDIMCEEYKKLLKDSCTGKLKI